MSPSAVSSAEGLRTDPPFRHTRRAAVDTALRRLELADRADDQVVDLSKGAEAARALVLSGVNGLLAAVDVRVRDPQTILTRWK